MPYRKCKECRKPFHYPYGSKEKLCLKCYFKIKMRRGLFV